MDQLFHRRRKLLAKVTLLQAAAATSRQLTGRTPARAQETKASGQGNSPSSGGSHKSAAHRSHTRSRAGRQRRHPRKSMGKSLRRIPLGRTSPKSWQDYWTDMILLFVVNASSYRICIFGDYQSLAVDSTTQDEVRHYYSGIFNSLEATFPPNFMQRAKVEQYIFTPEIKNIVACEVPERMERHKQLDKWRMLMEGRGFRGVPLGENAVAQSNMLLDLYPCRGYQLTRDNGCMFLGWQNRALVAASAWQ